MTSPDMQTPRSSSAVTEFGAGEGTIGVGNLPAISFLGQSPWTFELRMYLDALLDSMELVSRSGEFTLQTRDRSIFAARTGQSLALTSDSILDRHTWYHVAVSFDEVTMSLYVNGRRTDWVSLTDPGVANGGRPLTVGSSFYGWSTGFRAWNVEVGPGDIYGHQWVPSAVDGGAVGSGRHDIVATG
jgi:hypothetical protein